MIARQNILEQQPDLLYEITFEIVFSNVSGKNLKLWFDVLRLTIPARYLREPTTIHTQLIKFFKCHLIELEDYSHV